MDRPYTVASRAERWCCSPDAEAPGLRLRQGRWPSGLVQSALFEIDQTTKLYADLAKKEST